MKYQFCCSYGNHNDVLKKQWQMKKWEKKVKFQLWWVQVLAKKKEEEEEENMKIVYWLFKNELQRKIKTSIFRFCNLDQITDPFIESNKRKYFVWVLFMSGYGKFTIILGLSSSQKNYLILSELSK